MSQHDRQLAPQTRPLSGGEVPFDPGELGTVIAAPAIANALSSATGQRFRSLPLDLASAQPS